MKTSVAFLAVLAFATACGQGNEPLSVLGDPATVFNGTLAQPFTIGGNITTANLNRPVPYNAVVNTTTNERADGMEFVVNNNIVSTLSNSAVPVFAPGTGLVVQADNAAGVGANSLTIQHNGHVASKLSKLQTVLVRPGDFVTVGQQVATTIANVSFFVSCASANTLLRFSVYVDGVAVCPYSFFNSDFQTTVNNALINFTAISCGFTAPQAPCSP